MEKTTLVFQRGSKGKPPIERLEQIERIEGG